MLTTEEQKALSRGQGGCLNVTLKWEAGDHSQWAVRTRESGLRSEHDGTQDGTVSGTVREAHDRGDTNHSSLCGLAHAFCLLKALSSSSVTNLFKCMQ